MLCKKPVTGELTVTEIYFLWCDTAFFPWSLHLEL